MFSILFEIPQVFIVVTFFFLINTATETCDKQKSSKSRILPVYYQFETSSISFLGVAVQNFSMLSFKSVIKICTTLSCKNNLCLNFVFLFSVYFC